MIYFIAFLCVFGIAVGQIFFKMSALVMHETGSFFTPRALIILFMALLLYGTTTIGWVWVLQRIELGRIYPLMAFAFILVPLASYFVFGERFAIQYYAGIVLIAAGIFMTTKA